MNAKTLVTVVLLAFVGISVGYLVVSEANAPGAAEKSPAAVPTAADADSGAGGTATPAAAATDEAATESPAAVTPVHKVIAYYFHNTQRCMTCLKIEMLSEEALREQFADALDAGTLEWRVVNMEEPPNRHFAEDYQLVASSLVFVDLRDGVQRDWVNMEKVWELVHGDEATFKKYVADQAREYLES